MHIYRGDGHEGSTIVNYGIALNVTDDKVTVEYNGVVSDFFDTLRSGEIVGRTSTTQLDKEQLTWLEDSRTWVKHQIEDGQ